MDMDVESTKEEEEEVKGRHPDHSAEQGLHSPTEKKRKDELLPAGADTPMIPTATTVADSTIQGPKTPTATVPQTSPEAAVEISPYDFTIGAINVRSSESTLRINRELCKDTKWGSFRVGDLRSSIQVLWIQQGNILSEGAPPRLVVLKDQLHLPSLEEQQNKLQTLTTMRINSLEDWLLKYTGNPEGGELNYQLRIGDDFWIMFAAEIKGASCNFILINPPTPPNSMSLICSTPHEFLKSVEMLRADKDPRIRSRETLQEGKALSCHEDLEIDIPNALPFKERKAAFATALREFGSRLIPRQSSQFTSKEEPKKDDMKDHRNWMEKVIASGAPGSGKSRLLVELAALNQLAVNKPSEFNELISNTPLKKYASQGFETSLQQLRERVAQWVPVLVTFNGPTTATFADQADPALGVALRMLYSHLCVPGWIQLSEFRQWVTLPADPKCFAVQVILEDTKAKSIFLGIDEVMRLGSDNLEDEDNVKSVVDLLHEITLLSLKFRAFGTESVKSGNGASDSDNQAMHLPNQGVDLANQAVVFDVVTSLNEGVMVRDALHSGVRLCSLPLPPLTIEAREKMVARVFAQLCSEKAKQNLRVALADTGGRPGLVNAFALFLSQFEPLSKRFLEFCPYDLAIVTSLCRNTMWTTTDFDVVKDLVCCSKVSQRKGPDMESAIAEGRVFEDAKGNITVAPMAVASWADKVLTERENELRKQNPDVAIEPKNVIEATFVQSEDGLTQIQEALKLFGKFSDSEIVAMLLKSILQPTLACLIMSSLFPKRP